MRLVDPKLIPTRLIDPSQRRQVIIAEPEPPSRWWFATTALRIASLLLLYGWLRLLQRDPGHRFAHRMREFLEAMGGLWVKAGQLLSLRRDLFSTEFCNELSKLQDNAKGFPPALAREIIEKELRGPIEHIFDEFVDMPFAAASIGQIHRAHLAQEDVWVVVKVQRPDVAQRFHQQMAFIRFIARILDRFSVLPHLRPREMVWELEEIMNEELDYRIEGSNITRMRKTLRKHKVYAPKVFTRYNTRRVLVTEFIHAALMSDFIQLSYSDPHRVAAWLQENNIDPKEVGRRLFNTVLRQVFEDNLFHGDLHPGNIILLRDSRIALIDFGSVGSLETEFLRRYCLLLESMAGKDYSKAVDILFLLSLTLPVINMQEVKEKLIRLLRAWGTRTAIDCLPYRDRSINTLIQDMLRLLAGYKISMNWEFMKVDRVFLTVDATMMQMYPHIDYNKVIARFFRGSRQREMRQAARASIVSYGSGLSFVLKSIPELLHEYRTFQVPLFRRHAQIFQGSVSKIAYLISVTFGTAALGIALAAAFLVVAFLNQYHPDSIAWLRGDRWDDLDRVLPHFSYPMWLALLFGVFYCFFTAKTLQNRFAQQEVRLPDTEARER